MNSASPTIVVVAGDSLSGVDISTGTLALDNAPVAVNASGNTLTCVPTQSLTDGVHTVEATVQDRAGNAGTLAGEIWIDTLPPQTPALVGVADGAVLKGSMAVSAASVSDSGNGSGVKTVQVLIDGQFVLELAEPGFAGTLNSQGLSEGQHAVSVRAVDRAGNVSPASAAVNVVVNNVDMTIALTAPTAGIRVRDQVVAKATTSEPVKRVVFTVGSVSVTDDTPPYEATLDLSGQPEGAATITATATGLLDETATDTRDFVIDRTPPSAPDASLIFAEPPDNGNSLVFGLPGAVEGGASVRLTNVNTGATASATAGTDGAFSTFLAGAVSDTRL